MFWRTVCRICLVCSSSTSDSASPAPLPSSGPVARSYTDPPHRTRCSRWSRRPKRRPPLPRNIRRRAASPGPLRRRPARPHLVVPEQPTRRLQLAKVAPSISVHSEFANITRTLAPIRPLTCHHRRRAAQSAAGSRLGRWVPIAPRTRRPRQPDLPIRPLCGADRREAEHQSSYCAAQTPPMSAPAGLSSHQYDSGESSGGGAGRAPSRASPTT